MAAISAAAQGTINFCNVGTGLNSPVFQSDFTAKLAGPGYVAQLLAGPTANTMSLVGTPTPFLSGGSAGYFVGGTLSISGVAPGATAYVSVIAWDSTLGGTTTGATEQQAFAYMQAGFGSVWGTSGWDYVNAPTPLPVVTGPQTGPGALMLGLQSFSLAPPIPEPSTFVLILVGSGIALRTKLRRSS